MWFRGKVRPGVTVWGPGVASEAPGDVEWDRYRPRYPGAVRVRDDESGQTSPESPGGRLTLPPDTPPRGTRNFQVVSELVPLGSPSHVRNRGPSDSRSPVPDPESRVVVSRQLFVATYAEAPEAVCASRCGTLTRRGSPK